MVESPQGGMVINFDGPSLAPLPAGLFFDARRGQNIRRVRTTEDTTFAMMVACRGSAAMTGAQFEISLDGIPRTHRDRKNIGMLAAQILKSKTPVAWSR
jgi:hypothetical protein